MSKGSPVVSVRVTPELRGQIDRIAKDGRSVSDVLRDGLERGARYQTLLRRMKEVERERETALATIERLRAGEQLVERRHREEVGRLQAEGAQAEAKVEDALGQVAYYRGRYWSPLAEDFADWPVAELKSVSDQFYQLVLDKQYGPLRKQLGLGGP